MKKFNLLVLLCVFSATSISAIAADVKPKYGPTKTPVATTLAASHEYLQSSQRAAPDFWAMIGYYAPQITDSACSVASVAAVLNGARAFVAKTADDKLITQAALLEKNEEWKARISKEGWGEKKAHGTSLDFLRDLTESAFKANGFLNVEVKAVHVRDQSPKTLKAVHDALVENEKSAQDFIIANFNQKNYTDDADAGHISPVGAYDAKKKRVLILDTDRDWYEPYWISERAFIEGMNTKDNEKNDYRGFLVIKLVK